MMQEFRTSVRVNVLLFAVFLVVFGLAFARTYFRIQTTLMGYEIGRLKAEESDLLEERALLQMTYAKLTTKEALTKKADFPASPRGHDETHATR